MQKLLPGYLKTNIQIRIFGFLIEIQPVFNITFAAD